MNEVVRSGFDAPESIVHLFIGGSELHGAKVGATDDLDVYGIFVEPPSLALGLDPVDHFVWSTASDARRNGPEDVDLTLYSLRRWAALAAKGNATALHFIFADATATSLPVWTHLQERKSVFLSRKSAEQFLGFAENQRQRITGEKGHGSKGQRPEYIGQFGYDTKAAMHCLRLYLECIELMEQGTITLPRPERDYLIEVRSGVWSLDQFLNEAKKLRNRAMEAASRSSLPDEVDRKLISTLVADAHLRFWSTV
ncbi:Predicted nucleotidyltransferase [Bryocella elongata]|uniref:Predicted nucleotidyltransferase n=1 Tax=Bryocella elongata TaxID=863522 RepID=A0A1H5UI77_9BACT|nr:nucleotidyltransferase domain-containing protein [Bryocella elongata]SEF73967.1 Predicted nucleotidyltransferase [Bryocella elongata]